MTTYYLNGTPIQEGSTVSLNGFTYPYSWLETTSQTLRASYGIEKIGDINYDEKYYWGLNNPKNLEDKEEVDQEGNPLFVKVWDPEATVEGSQQIGAMVDSANPLTSKGLKTTTLEGIRATTNELLRQTDFYIIRNSVEQVEIPSSVSEYRSAVIAESQRVQDAIQEVTTVEQLIDVMNSVSFPRAE